MTRTLSTRRRLLAVLAGGFLGTLTRYALSTLIQSWLGKNWPFDILFINITGAFLLAFVTTLADATFLVGPTRRLFINVGFLGAYTTFSSLALGDILLLGKDQWQLALLYLLASVVGGVLAALMGDWMGQSIVRLARRTTLRAKTTRKLSGALSSPFAGEIPGRQHVDIQDDLLISDELDELEARRRHS